MSGEKCWSLRTCLKHALEKGEEAFPHLFPSSQKATALAAATFRESTSWDMGIFTV